MKANGRGWIVRLRVWPLMSLSPAERMLSMNSDPVETARTARERLVVRRRSLLDDVASMDRVSIEYAADLRIIQDAIDVVDKAVEEEHALPVQALQRGLERVLRLFRFTTTQRGLQRAVLPIDPEERNALGLALGRIAVAAGRPVLELFRTGVSVRTKSDASPVTEADLAAEKVILEGAPHPAA